VHLFGTTWNNYKVSNEDLFDKHKQNDAPHYYNAEITEDKKKALV
jgi:hypothetical protein